MRDGWAQKNGRRSDYSPGGRISGADIDGQDTPKANAFGILAGSLSGAVMGFLAAGYLELSGAALVGATVGLTLGWKARGLSQ